MKYFMHGVDKNAICESMGRLKELNFDAVVTSFNQETIDSALEHGLEPYVFSGTYSMTEAFKDDRYLCEDINGNPQIWFNSTCPNKKDVREYNIEAIRKKASARGVKGIFLDGARFSSPCSGRDNESFFTCFCDDCRQKAEAFGLDFIRMRRDVKRLYDEINSGNGVASWANALAGGLDMIPFFQSFPGVFDWLNFRRICTTEHVLDVAKAVKESKEGCLMALYIFTPSLAGLVGQSYIDLRRHVDIFSPMIYRAYHRAEGPACLNTELFSMAEMITNGNGGKWREAVRMISRLTGFCLPGYEGPEDIEKGLPPCCIGVETAKARALLGPNKMLAPIIQLDDKALNSSIKEVQGAGADGINFYSYDKEWIGMLPALS
ncbi:MAG: hypothetical protein ACOX8S_11930 [Christensenellales bacterium]|jgi:hypothetical protein